MKLSPRTAQRRTSVLLLSAIVCLGLARTPAWAQQETQSYPAATSAARKSAWQAITNGRGSGMAVAIMDKGKFVYSEGMGVRNWSQNDKLDKQTKFNIGSTSKMFTAVAVLLLVDEGKVKLDEPITTYIPEFAMEDQRYQEITVRMLFNHSSGLPGSSFYITTAPLNNSHELTLSTLRRSHLKHDPGAVSMYCNDGFTLAEILVQRVSGQKFLDFLQERIFTPLAMHDTGASLGELEGTVDRADYTEAKSGKTYPTEILEVHGAGGLSSTVEDLCRFGNSFTPYGRKILSDASLKEIRTTQPTPFSKQLRHRGIWSEFGWDYSNLSPYDKKGIQVLAKGGNTVYYSTNLQILPDQALVIAACISGAASGENLTRPILVGLLQDRNLVQEPAVSPSKPPQPQTIPEDFKKHAGFYAGDGGSLFKLAFSDDNQHITLDKAVAKTEKGEEEKPPAEPTISLAYNDGLFVAPDGKLACYFLNVDGKDYLISTPSGGGKNVSSIYAVDYLMLQRLDQLKDPLTMPLQEAGKLWLLRNLPPSSLAQAATFVATPATYEGLEGYQQFLRLIKVESPTYGSIAATRMRDQSELQLHRDNGTLWAQVDVNLYSLTTPQKSSPGLNTISIGPDGYNQWLEISEQSVVRLDGPKGGKIVIVTPDSEILFNSDVDSDPILVPQNTLVFCAGPVGSQFKVTLE